MQEVRLKTLSDETVPLTVQNEMYVDGEFVGGDESFETENPTTGQTLVPVLVATPEQGSPRASGRRIFGPPTRRSTGSMPATSG